MKNIIGLILCFLSVLLLASSDGLINMSAASVIGATDDSRSSARLVAIGVTVALLALGSVVVIIKDDLGKLFTWLAVIFASIFSCTLTIQAVAVDYAVNDNSSQSSQYIRGSNDILIDSLQHDKEINQQLIDECERDRYFNDKCHRAIADNKRITREIAALLKKSNESAIAQTVDITEAVETKAGISGALIETIGIYSRAIAVPIMITICMMGFWFFWERIAKSKKPKATVSATDSSATKTEKPLSKPVNSSKTSKNSSNLKPKAIGTKSDKSAIKARTKAIEYYSKHGKYPASRELQSLASVGPKKACDVLRELKSKAA